jgi:parallel beta-helix repeat protein
VAVIAPATAPALAQDVATLVSASGYGTFHAAGVLATVSGDANRNATMALEWRVTGGTFAAAHPLARIDASHLAGSLFWLTPGTSYEARVTLSDPDGVTGAASMVAAFATRPDTLPEPSLRTLHVSPTGDDANPGTPGAPLRTIQRAADLAQAGDLVLVKPGVYRETVTVPRSGTASQPIVFRGDGPGAILDGADAAIAAGVTWTAGGNGVHSRGLAFPTGHVVTEAGRLYRYASLAALQGLAAGAPGGFFFDGATLYLKLADGSAPSAHVVHVARLEDGIVVDGRAFVRIENLEIRHYGAGGYGKGVYLRYASDCTVRTCRIHDVGAAGVWVKGGDRHRIEDNEVSDTSIFGWPWDLAKGSSAETNGVSFTDEVGRGHVVRRNTLQGTFNGIGPCGSAPPPTGVTNETDVYENVLRRHTDDGFEPEGYCSNVRIWGNYIEDVHMGFAVAPAGTGPVFVLRNVAHRFGNTRTSQLDGYVASALKINSGYATPIGPLFLYHNTFLTDAPATDALALLNPGASTFIRARNNVIAGTQYAIYKVNPVLWDGNGNDLFTSAPGRLVSWEGTRYDTLAAFRTALGQEAQGLSADPELVAPGSGIFEPAAGSPLVDAGLAIAGINDSFEGAAPDVGAVEKAGPAPPRSFFSLTPCRLADTRDAAGPRGGPALAAGTVRAFTAAGVCGIPATARAVSLNLAVTAPTASGDLRLFATGGAPPLASVINYSPGQTRANNAIAPLNTSGQLTLRCDQATGSVHAILDVNGYFE